MTAPTTGKDSNRDLADLLTTEKLSAMGVGRTLNPIETNVGNEVEGGFTMQLNLLLKAIFVMAAAGRSRPLPPGKRE